MKKTILASVLLVFAFACSSVAYEKTKLDQMRVLLSERVGGKDTGNFMYLNISVYKADGETAWTTNRTVFHRWDKDESFSISSASSASKWSFDRPHIKVKKWDAGNMLEAEYNIEFSPEPLTLVAKRVGSKEKSVWDIKLTGIRKETNVDKGEKWEFETVSEIPLKDEKFSVEGRFTP